MKSKYNIASLSVFFFIDKFVLKTFPPMDMLRNQKNLLTISDEYHKIS